MIDLKIGAVLAIALAIPNAIQWVRYLRGYKQRVFDARAAGNKLAVFSERLTLAGFALANASGAVIILSALFRHSPQLVQIAFFTWVAAIVAICVSWFISGWSEGVRNSQ